MKLKSKVWTPPKIKLEEFCYYRIPSRPFSINQFNYYKKVNEDKRFEHLDYSLYLKGFSEHDAIHYLLSYGFNEDGERRTVFIEKHCDIGWFSIHKSLNQFKPINNSLPKGFGKKLILKTAQNLRELY